MELPELHEIVSRWMTSGLISNSEKEALKLEYFRVTGTSDEGRCTRCPDFWNDVQMILRIHLKQSGFKVMAKKARKWSIIGGVYLPMGSSVHYVNEGEKAAHIEVITDKVAEALMKQNPDLEGTVFEVDPEYVEPEKPAADPEKPAKPARQPNPAKPKTTPSAKPKVDPPAPAPEKPSEPGAGEGTNENENDQNPE